MTNNTKRKNYLEKIPFDYYDFFNKNYVEGKLRLVVAQDLKMMGHNALSFIFVMLARENLMHMKAIARVPEH